MERKLINWTAGQIGYNVKESDGVFTAGGSQSNLMGLVMIRDSFSQKRYNHNIKIDSLPAEAGRFRIFVSDQSHFSNLKNASIMGLGEKSIVKVPMDERFRMNISLLKKYIKREEQLGNIPIGIIGTAGTTDFGNIDPLEDIANIAEHYNIWMHVDAAYGCALLLSNKYRDLINAIERADSVTIDYHKPFFQPISSSAFIVKNKKELLILKHHADYLNPKEIDEEEFPAQINKSIIQSTRRFDALKLWFTLRMMGKEQLAEYTDTVIDLTKVSILSTGNIRGLSPKQMKFAPAITDWIKSLIKDDAYLENKGTIFLGEEATVAYLHPQYGAIASVPYQYNEFLGALWRESAKNYLKEGEQMITMASLLYVDDLGVPLVQAWVEKAGISIKEWVESYLDAYLTPLLHIYYTHSLCVTPHGENIMIILRNKVPQRIVIKDFVDDIVLTIEAREKLPAHLADGIIQSSNKENIPLFILLGVFDAFFRYLSNILHTYSEFNEQIFWKLVHHCVKNYKAKNVHLQERFEKYDLYVPTFKRLYINSLHLKDNGYSENNTFAIPRKDGALRNPLYQIVNKSSVISA